MNGTENRCIEFLVKQCAHHCQTTNFCSLDRIVVGSHEPDPTMVQCTDCMSFAKK